MKKEVKQIISQLKNGEISVYDIPSEYQSDFDVIKAERKIGLRKVSRCGYDVISDKFFVEEVINQGEEEIYEEEQNQDEEIYEDEDMCEQTGPMLFDDFSTYAHFIEWRIFENACYYQLAYAKLPEGIDKAHLFKKKSFIDYTIDDYILLPTGDEIAKYQEGEKNKNKVRKWIEKFVKCTTYQQLMITMRNYKKSTLYKDINIDVNFFLWNYIFATIGNWDSFLTIMEYVSSGGYFTYEIRDALCSIYNPDDVENNYKYELGSERTNKKRIRAMKSIAQKVKE